MDRREFLKLNAALGLSAALGAPGAANALGKTPGRPLQGDPVDIAVITGTDYFQNAVSAVEMLGGMSRFVPNGATVGLLLNSPWRNPGTYTNPDVALAVLKMCIDAGAADIFCLKDTPRGYWQRSALAERYADEISGLRSPGRRRTVEIPNGKKLKQADVARELMESDVIINVPIVKDHNGSRFTCGLKNMMGACSRSTNRFFHFGSGADDWYDDVDHLSQCIADLNLVRKPGLLLVDATEFVTANGPAGPGPMARPQKVVAGTDPVAVDACCAEILGRRIDDIQMIEMAYEHGLGEKDLQRLRIEEAVA
jgi:uncharacterized protein (DUF362 family)